MPRRKESKGHCSYCGQEMTKGKMTRHLSSCLQRQEVIAKGGRRKGKSEKLYHLRVQDTWRGEFWLDLEMRGSANLEVLDAYLRAIWLECCGHMSQFSIGGWRGDEIPKKTIAEKAFEPGIELTHIYDFGTSSETLIKVVGVREGKPATSHPIMLMARNVIPEAKCIECEEEARWLCNECLIEEDVWGVLCEEHAERHPHDGYGEPVPIVNSPRLGMCGYEGPAEPPY